MMKLIGNLVWLITALASIHIGLTIFGIDITSHTLFQHAMLMTITKYTVGIAGIISLLMMISSLMGGQKCDCK